MSSSLISQDGPQPPQGRFEFLYKMEDGWCSVDVPWHTPGDGWLMAHDLFHHLPTDTGKPEEEVATYGAEDWFAVQEDPDQKNLKELSTTVFSIAMISTESLADGLSITEIMLPAAAEPCSVNGLDPAMVNRWRDGYTQGMAHLEKFVFELATAEEWADLQSEDQINRAVGWMAHGWHTAAARYAEPAMACQQFHAVEKAFSDPKYKGAGQLVLTLTKEGVECEGLPAVPTKKPRPPR